MRIKKGKRNQARISREGKRQGDGEKKCWNETKRVGNGHILVNETLSNNFLFHDKQRSGEMDQFSLDSLFSCEVTCHRLSFCVFTIYLFVFPLCGK